VFMSADGSRGRSTGNQDWFTRTFGASLADLKARMGHDSARTAMIYQHATTGGSRAPAVLPMTARTMTTTARPECWPGSTNGTLMARPHPIQDQNQVFCLVELLTHYSNTPDLLSNLRRTVQAVTEMVVEDDEPDISTVAPVFRPTRIEDRLSASDVDQLVVSFKAGTTIRELVEHYGICRTSVKNVLRRHGVRR
jgi:hypothetical protein